MSQARGFVNKKLIEGSFLGFLSFIMSQARGFVNKKFIDKDFLGFYFFNAKKFPLVCSQWCS